jgi:cytochrome c-type biogenesis protein CcmH
VLSRELRCMVCQNQSIDDSDAPLARDLRLIVRERLKAGDKDNEVIDFLVARYGEFVLLKPRFAWHTAVLWAAPVLLLLSGAVILIVFARRRGVAPGAPSAADLSPQEQARLRELTAQRD